MIKKLRKSLKAKDVSHDSESDTAKLERKCKISSITLNLGMAQENRYPNAKDYYNEPLNEDKLINQLLQEGTGLDDSFTLNIKKPMLVEVSYES